MSQSLSSTRNSRRREQRSRETYGAVGFIAMLVFAQLAVGFIEQI